MTTLEMMRLVRDRITKVGWSPNCHEGSRGELCLVNTVTRLNNEASMKGDVCGDLDAICEMRLTAGVANGMLSTWNDAHGRTKTDVYNVINVTIDRLEHEAIEIEAHAASKAAK